MDDQPTRPQRAALARGHAKLGRLTPAFISTDDLVRYLHERIAPRLKLEHASVLLQRLSDGLYLANEPIPDRPTVFNWNLLLDVDPVSQDFMDPEGFRIVGGWHAHTNMTDWVKRENPSWTADEVTAFQGFYSEPDIIIIFQDRHQFKAVYLSGPDGTLLKFEPDDSTAGADYARWLRNRGGFDSPHAHSGTLSGYYQKLASLGRLTFLASIPAWGDSVGAVPADWQPRKPFKAPALALPCSPVFMDKQQALSHAWSRIQRRPTARQHVLILQRDGHEHYLAGEPERESSVGGQLPLLPAGCHLHGIYFHSRPLPGLYPDQETWLFKHFVSPLELAQRIAQFRHYSRGAQPTLGVSLYIRMRDEAILRYRFSGSAAESRLFTQAADGTVDTDELQSELHSGVLLTRDFVRQVARAGELTVEKTSALWDRSGVVDDTWTPYSQVVLPALSAAFLTADDAALHAHRRIGRRREQVLGGLILKRGDGRFVVTEPLPAGPRPFAFAGGYPLDRQKQPIILHPDHHLHGRYASRTALSLTDPAQAIERKWTRQEAELYAQMFLADDVADLLATGQVGYLSGTEDCLLALAPSNTTLAWRKQWSSETAGMRSAINQRLDEGKIKPADVVRTLAEAGTLRIVLGNALWGPAGFVEVDWGPWVRALTFQRPATVSHGPIFESADAAARERHRHAAHYYGDDHVSRYFAFVLKHRQREEYVASELVPVTRQSALLSFTRLYGGALPEGFDCHSLYYSKPWVGNGTRGWLQRFFIEPEDLSEALFQARVNALLSPLGAPVYIAVPDGALLRYQSPSTQGLFETNSIGDSAATVRAKLNVGTLTLLQFVRNVAISGRLEVVQASPCWDREGTVTGLWTPYAQLLRRRLSPAFVSMDDAALYVRRRVPTNIEHPYGGLVLRREDGWFFATEPLRVPDDSFDLKWIFPDELATRGEHPPRTVPVASYYARPAQQWPFILSPAQSQVYDSMFSTRALAQVFLTERARMHHYWLAADGAVLRLNARPEEKAPLVTTADLVPRPRNHHDWLNGRLERMLREGELTPTEYVNRVAQTFALHVVKGSALWGSPGPVRGWQPFASVPSADGAYVQAHQDPACSPVHAQADDAVRYAHELAGTRSELQFGYVLESTSTGHFIATLPITDAGANLAHRRVFSDAGYPHRYALGGLYLCAPQVSEVVPSAPAQAGDGVYQGLFWPSRLIEAMYQVTTTQERPVLPLYLSCADGALLRFVVRDPRFIGYGDDVKLRLRLLSPRDFIRRMAAAGELRILVPSEHWPGTGIVGVDWQPGRSRGVEPAGDNYRALGPVHAHQDDAAGFVHARAGRFTGQQAISALLEGGGVMGKHVPVLALPDNGFPSATAARLFVTGPWPAGLQVRAAHLLFHAGLDQPQMGVERLYGEYFVSFRELAYYIHSLKQQGLAINGFYLTARDGALLGYAPRFDQAEYNLLATTGKWSAEGGYTTFAPDPSHVVAELARTGRLRVLHSGEFWTLRGALRMDLKLPGSPGGRPSRDEL
ncbi:hypothetical protein BLL37_19220 [Pseudomonas azotoformans]|uniref:Uncharacterized protein n=1 Tax=Pseudomonas azotoformans TaxID=47878 RepID=A0A1V2JF11_PSEAZ|nr:DUF4329 domain-containing protein [Pseudomonas azotoformans]OIN51926.1 hypothetical protein BFL39_04455 [Pseudomonas azotoformans]ONH43923.1 hypothetical protein BLL37_19220 [Pseudomonas azotoformans]SDO60047.1 hypothetical protein SAMN04489799_5045 [Pseudomonas azotoformans]